MNIDIAHLTREIANANPMYHDFLFEETRDFLSHLIKDPDHAPKAKEAEFFIFAAGQGFLTGYGAALDFDYDENETCSCDTPEFIAATGDIEEMTEWQKARTAKYNRANLAFIGEGPATYYSTYGFANGLLKGLSDMEDGSAQMRSATDLTDDILNDICADAVYDAIDVDEDVFLSLIAGAHQRNQKKVRKTKQSIISAAKKAAIKYVSERSMGYSGYNDTDPQIVYNRARTYATAYLDGIIECCMGDLPALGDYEDEVVPPEFEHPLGAFSHIDIYFEGDIEKALLAKTEIVQLAEALEGELEYDDFEDEYDDYDDDDFEYDDYDDDEPTDLPPFTDAFWQIHAIGYVEGVEYAKGKPHLRVEHTPENEARFNAIIDDQINSSKTTEFRD